MLASELAKLHQVPLQEACGVLRHPTVPDRAMMLTELDAFEGSWREHDPEPSLGMRFAFSWLHANIHLAVEGDPALTHRDPLFHNVLADGDSMTALLDWEFVRIGYPAEDLGWIRTVVSQAMPWEECMSAYRQAGGNDIRPAVVDFYAIWAAVRLGMMLTYSNWLTSTGQTGSIEYTSTALRETHVARQWLAAHLERVLACARVPRSEPR
jgi:aminoglycoside phosphotransferase (APT) family kinase protein